MVAAFIRTEIPGSNCAILIKLRAEQRLQGSRIVAVKSGDEIKTDSSAKRILRQRNLVQ
jgi:hypothetical protein